ncbi:MAG: alpha-N-acetylglucosaminidase C-terminal domain-containing protein, partial [Bacteroidota bacterium]|nr:alpha-N-acetylglucosaminidase C-terminal domain-containing protein [Bacteroidota bacterium]
EAANYWEKREGYDNHNWAWCTVSNFGEKTGLYGRLERLATEPPRALAGPYGKYMVGIGAMPEGVLNNPVYFDLHYDMGWNEKPVDIQLWIRNYVQYRYGKAPQSALEAWDLLLRSAYKTDETSQEGCAESILCARPSFSIKSVSTWGTAKLYYDPKVTIQALNKLWEASKEIGTVDAYLYDLVDLSRQVLGNQGRELYKEMQEAYATKDLNHFNQAASQFLTILREQDELLSSRKEFLVGNWIAHARKLGKTKADQDLLEKNARAQITYWGPDTNTTTNLHEYAHKEWAGLMKDFYLPRWELFIQESQNALKENRPLKEIDFFTMELKWNQQRNPYPSKPQTNPLKAVQKIITSNTF